MMAKNDGSIELEGTITDVLPNQTFKVELDNQYIVTCYTSCLLYTSDAADDSLRVDLGGRRSIKKIRWG